MKYMNEDISRKQIFIMIFFFFILILMVIGIYFLSHSNYEKVKIDKDKDYIYRKQSPYTGEYVNIPYINIKGDAAKKYNQEIMQLEKEFASLPENRVGFVFNKSNHILSLSIKLVDYYTADHHPRTTFKTYILNLKTKRAYTKEEIYKRYGVDDEVVRKSMEKQFKKLYQAVVKEKYVDPNYCDYSCFLAWRNVENYLDGAQLYIENNALIVFRGFKVESVFGEEKYFQNKDFKFKIEV